MFHVTQKAALLIHNQKTTNSLRYFNTSTMYAFDLCEDESRYSELSVSLGK